MPKYIVLMIYLGYDVMLADASPALTISIDSIFTEGMWTKVFLDVNYGWEKENYSKYFKKVKNRLWYTLKRFCRALNILIWRLSVTDLSTLPSALTIKMLLILSTLLSASAKPEILTKSVSYIIPDSDRNRIH